MTGREGVVRATRDLAPFVRASPARRFIVTMLGIGSVWRGVSYCLPPHSPYAASDRGGVVDVFAMHSPMWILGVAWIAVGAFALASAAVGRWIIATTLVGAVWVIWGAAYLVAWLIPGWGLPSDWISTGTYLWQGLATLGACLIREEHPRPAREV